MSCINLQADQVAFFSSKDKTSTWGCHSYHFQAQDTWLPTATQPWPSSAFSVVQELTNPTRPHTKGKGSYGFKTLLEEQTVKESLKSRLSILFTSNFSSFLQKECNPCDQRSLRSTIQCEQTKDKQNMQCRLIQGGRVVL